MSCTAAVNKVELEGVNSEPLACALCSTRWSCDIAASLQSGAWWSAASPSRASGHACSQSVSELICLMPSLCMAACPPHLREELGVQMPGSMPSKAAWAEPLQGCLCRVMLVCPLPNFASVTHTILCRAAWSQSKPAEGGPPGAGSL